MILKVISHLPPMDIIVNRLHKKDNSLFKTRIVVQKATIGFRQSMGVSPEKYVIQQRVERAKRLFRQPQKMAIATIALE